MVKNLHHTAPRCNCKYHCDISHFETEFYSNDYFGKPCFHFPELTGSIKLILDPIYFCYFVINEFSPTCEVQYFENSVLQSSFEMGAIAMGFIVASGMRLDYEAKIVLTNNFFSFPNSWVTFAFHCDTCQIREN